VHRKGRQQVLLLHLGRIHLARILGRLEAHPAWLRRATPLGQAQPLCQTAVCPEDQAFHREWMPRDIQRVCRQLPIQDTAHTLCHHLGIRMLCLQAFLMGHRQAFLVPLAFQLVDHRQGFHLLAMGHLQAGQEFQARWE
jgi:hypothetical protein